MIERRSDLRLVAVRARDRRAFRRACSIALLRSCCDRRLRAVSALTRGSPLVVAVENLGVGHQQWIRGQRRPCAPKAFQRRAVSSPGSTFSTRTVLVLLPRAGTSPSLAKQLRYFVQLDLVGPQEQPVVLDVGIDAELVVGLSLPAARYVVRRNRSRTAGAAAASSLSPPPIMNSIVPAT